MRRRGSDAARELHVTDLVAVIGHELSTPLTTINAAIELMESSQGQRPNALTNTIQRQVTRLLMLFDASLRAAEVLGGAAIDELAVAPLAETLERVRHGWPASEQRLRIVVDCAPGLPLVAIEQRALEIVLNNLLVNASKHSGGMQVTIAARGCDGYARITVSDDGRGIPAHLRKRVFELGSRRDAKSGSGLGLYVTRELVRAFGGTLRLGDSPLGACFAVTLPFVLEEAS